MGWFRERFGFDESGWPQDPYLNPFRDAVWRLSLDEDPQGWVTTSVSPMRSLPLFWVRQESMWSQVHWSDGRRDFLEEDYSPWITVEEMLSGRFTTLDPHLGRDRTYDIVRVSGPERDRLWADLAHGVQTREQ